MRTRVKICGITRREDAQLAAALGADAVGFIFWPRSPRVIAADAARAIGDALPPFVARVGVFVDASPDSVARTVRDARLQMVQLHGDERVEDFTDCGASLIKTVSLTDDEAVVRAQALPPAVTPLVDAHDPARRGGTGRAADWARARRLAAGRPIVLAGGLDADNVGEAVRLVRPWAVDLSSGVEAAPGIKDSTKLAAFFRATAAASQEAE